MICKCCCILSHKGLESEDLGYWWGRGPGMVPLQRLFRACRAVNQILPARIILNASYIIHFLVRARSSFTSNMIIL